MTSPATAAQRLLQIRPRGSQAARRVRSCGLLACVLLTACASAPKPTEIAVMLKAAANVNPGISQEAKPLLVRIYELKTASAFHNADFVSLLQRDQAELGADLVAREEVSLEPGTSRQLPLRVAAPETRFIGVLAAYRDLDRAQWRVVVPVRPAQKQTLTITAEALAISAVMAP